MTRELCNYYYSLVRCLIEIMQVPSDQPVAALTMLNTFLANKPFSSTH